MSSVTPLIVTHPCALVRDGLRPILAKSPFRPVHILPVLNEETESYLAGAGICIWLVGVNEYRPTTNDLVRRAVAANPSLRAVILAASHTAADILPAFQAGACGFLRQDIPSFISLISQLHRPEPDNTSTATRLSRVTVDVSSWLCGICPFSLALRSFRGVGCSVLSVAGCSGICES